MHWSTAQDYVPRRFFIQIFSSIQGFTQGSLGLLLFFWDFVVLGTRTLRKGGVMIRWLGRLGRCVGASDHASFCLPCGVCFGCVLGHFIVTLPLHLHYHAYNEVVMRCNHSFSSPVCLSCVHRSCGEPCPTSVGFGARALSPSPPPRAPLCSEALPVALQGRDWQKCDLRHAGQHAGL